MANDYERKIVDEKIQEILEKYKDKAHLYPKLKKFANRFSNSKYVDPKIYGELANLTSKINYRCYFNNGKCTEYKNDTNDTIMCCCSGCMRNNGFLNMRFFRHYDSINEIEEELLYYVKKFSIKTGFWRKGKGCILPREKRSSTCLCYACTDKLTNEEKLLLDIIRDYEQFPNYIRRIIRILKDYFLYKS